ncbi:arginine--tRNA ligase [Candidatus Falkowbacteria bacterium]|nr:arginine--tRNA ligase [Candidatus Falkowbacteria bacterium]
MQFKKEIAEAIKETLKQFKVKTDKTKIEAELKPPPAPALGDFAFPCFSLAKSFKKNPTDIAKLLRDAIRKTKNFDKIDASGPYLNFFIEKTRLAAETIKQVLKEKQKYGRGQNKIGRVMIEFPSPNTNKPLHLGHLRNMAIGESVARLLEATDNKVIRANLNNDRGVHICKSMLAYQKFGRNKKPDKKTDHFVGDYYVRFAKELEKNSKLQDETQALLVKWENGDKKTIALWKKMTAWAIDGFKETYKTFGIKHDITYFESSLYDKGRNIVNDGLKKGVFQKRADGAILIDLTKDGLDEKILLRADGTAVYITQDLYLAKLKNDKFNLDGSIYVVGSEQEYHFKVLFLILRKLGFKFAKNLKHLSYGMVMLPEGRMKSREGTVVDADDLIEEVRQLAEKELTKRYHLPTKELKSRGLKIALAAIKYHFLRPDVGKTITFNPKESISFDGNTGPYILYAYARAGSIIKKSNRRIAVLKIFSVNQEERNLINKISELPQTVLAGAREYNSAPIANYVFDLAQIFNAFYHQCPVIGSDNESLRLNLTNAFRQTLKNALYLLGIETIEEM